MTGSRFRPPPGQEIHWSFEVGLRKLCRKCSSILAQREAITNDSNVAAPIDAFCGLVWFGIGP